MLGTNCITPTTPPHDDSRPNQSRRPTPHNLSGGARGAIARVAAPSAETLPQAEVESALEDVNAAAARMGYKGAKEEGGEDEEEGEGEEEGHVFPAAAADAVTTRLRDLDDGCVA